MDIHESLQLPCGAVLSNRSKAAMTAQLIRSNQKHYTFYNLQLDRLGMGQHIQRDYSPARLVFHLVEHEFVKAMEDRFTAREI